MEGVRLNKYIGDSGFCSRREADKLIEEGRVKVNGKRGELGTRVLPGDKVIVDGYSIAVENEQVYIILNKPVGVVCTTDPADPDNIVDFVGHEKRIFPIGRLDKDSQGLILLTNNGDIVNQILRAENDHKKEYVVTVNRPISDEFVEKMQHGVPILDRVTRKCEVEKLSTNTFRIVLSQGLNRQIRRMCEYFSYEVTKLIRVKLMNIELGKLPIGQWRNLTSEELQGMFKLLESSVKVDTISKTAKKTKATKSKSAGAPAKADQPKGKAKSHSKPTSKFTPKAKPSGTGKRIGKSRPDRIK